MTEDENFLYIFNASDAKWKDGEFIGLKRKYGKHKREVFKIPSEQTKCQLSKVTLHQNNNLEEIY